MNAVMVTLEVGGALNAASRPVYETPWHGGLVGTVREMGGRFFWALSALSAGVWAPAYASDGWFDQWTAAARDMLSAGA